MFDEILISSLSNMDDSTLQATLESMTDDEVAYVDAVLEAKYTPEDIADFKDIMRIENAAHRDGWKNVSKDDYDRYVNIMANTKHLLKMHQAKKFGREKAVIDRDKQYLQGNSDMKSHIGNAIDGFSGNNLVRAGSIVGAATGIGIPVAYGVRGGVALAKAVKDSVRFDDDRKGLKERGIKYHPDQQWQIDRAKKGLSKLKYELLKDRHIIPRKKQNSTKEES